MDLYTFFQHQNSFRKKNIYEMFFGYTVYTLVESASDGTTGFEPATPNARFDEWILPKVTMREVRTITSILCSSPRLTAEQVHYHGVI
jgi:hypothetical protein